MIGILDYGMGNIKSVENAIEAVGYDSLVVTESSDFDKIEKLIIPGVGTYSKAMRNLHDRDLIDSVIEFVKSNRPVLGICLGMQILSTLGLEVEETEGLNIIPGEVVPINSNKVVVPHAGWNSLEVRVPHPIFDGIKKHVDFYFVHSFYYKCDDDEMILSSTDYGDRFVSAVFRDNVVGLQFHPEKSQSNGLKIIENFCDWDWKC